MSGIFVIVYLLGCTIMAGVLGWFADDFDYHDFGDGVVCGVAALFWPLMLFWGLMLMIAHVCAKWSKV